MKKTIPCISYAMEYFDSVKQGFANNHSSNMLSVIEITLQVFSNKNLMTSCSKNTY